MGFGIKPFVDTTVQSVVLYKKEGKKMRLKFFICFALVAFIALGFSLVSAQAGPTPGPVPDQGQKTEKQMTPEQFAAMKNKILNMLEVRRTKIEEAKVCVTAATTPEELRKCRPEHPIGMGMKPHMRGQRGMGQQQPPQPPTQ